MPAANLYLVVKNRAIKSRSWFDKLTMSGSPFDRSFEPLRAVQALRSLQVVQTPCGPFRLNEIFALKSPQAVQVLKSLQAR